MAKYSLADYILTITLPADLASQFGTDTISVGGEGSYLGSIVLGFNSNIWETEGDATGSWVHNRNLDRTGTVDVTLNMLSDNVAKFIRVCNLYYNSETITDGLTMTVSTLSGTNIANCLDCFITKIPNQEFEEKAKTQSWSFTCGKITIQ